jgi:hypothetical protein
VTEAAVSSEQIRERWQKLEHEANENRAAQAWLTQRAHEIEKEKADLQAAARVFGIKLDDKQSKKSQSHDAEIIQNTIKWFLDSSKAR